MGLFGKALLHLQSKTFYALLRNTESTRYIAVTDASSEMQLLLVCAFKDTLDVRTATEFNSQAERNRAKAGVEGLVDEGLELTSLASNASTSFSQVTVVIESLGKKCLRWHPK